MAEKKKRIKVSEEEKALRKELGLPVTKELRYMRRILGGYEELKVNEYEVADFYETMHSLLITLSSGEKIRILAPYFAEMQKPSFERDMQEQAARVAEE